MALTKVQKTAQVTELTEKLKGATSVMFSHFIGLTVGDVSSLRKKLKQGKAEMKVAKKTLMEIAFKEAGYPAVDFETLDGPVACIFSFEDPLSGAQIAFKFGKERDQVALIGGVFEGKSITKEEAIAIAKIPGRLELLTIFACMLNAPLSGFARGLKEVAGKRESVKDKKDAKETSSDSSPAPPNTSSSLSIPPPQS